MFRIIQIRNWWKRADRNSRITEKDWYPKKKGDDDDLIDTDIDRETNDEESEEID